MLHAIFHIQDVSVVVHRPQEEAVDGYVEGVVSLQSASPLSLCTINTYSTTINLF